MLQAWSFKCNNLFLHTIGPKHNNRISKEEVIENMYQITLDAMSTQEIIVPKSINPVELDTEEFKNIWNQIKIRDEEFLKVIIRQRGFSSVSTGENFKKAFLYNATIFRDFRVFEEIKKSCNIAADNKLINDAFYLNWINKKIWIYFFSSKFYEYEFKAEASYEGLDDKFDMKLIYKYLKVEENLDVLNYIAYNRDLPGRAPRPLMNKPSDVRSSAYLPYKQIALEESRKDLRSKTSILIPEVIAVINSLKNIII